MDNFPESKRELGLDYEPPCKTGSQCTSKCQQCAVQEPVAWVCYGAPGKRDIDFEEADINKLPIGTQLYTTPPAAKREWTGLTKEEIKSLKKLAIDPVDANGWGFFNRERFAELIEAKLKEKNT